MLLLSNSDEIESKIADGNGRIAKLVKAKATPAEAVEELYLATLARRPTEAEKTRSLAHLASQKDLSRGLEDLLWALINSKEFLFNH